ncbi:WD40 repeat protein, partial [Spiromyces aspiralis]
SLSGPNGDIAAALNSHDGKGVSRIAAVSDLHASPRRQVEVSHLLAQCACSSDGEYLAGITTTNTVYLWSLKPFSLLSALEYDYIEEFGRMVDLYWRPNSRSLYIVMSKGVVYELYVYDLDEPVMQFAFTTPHHFALGVGESEEVVGKGIGQLRTLRLPEGTRAVCGTAAASLMLVISEQHARYLTWEGMSEATIAVQDVLGSPLAWVVQAVPTGCGGGGEQTVWVSSDGRAYVVTLSRASEGGVSFVELPSSAGSFTSASYSPQLRLLALGSSSGHITMFATDSDGGSEYLFTRPVDPYRAAGGEPVVSLAWTRDGLALAVGLRSGKVAVLSSSGTLLNTTELKGPGGEYTSNFVPVQLHWNAGSTELFALGSLMLGNGAQ